MCVLDIISYAHDTIKLPVWQGCGLYRTKLTVLLSIVGRLVLNALRNALNLLVE